MLEPDLRSLPIDKVMALALPGMSARARRRLKESVGLAGLPEAGADEIASVLDEPDARRASLSLVAAFELLRRADAKPLDVVRSSEDVAAWAKPRLGTLRHEELWLLSLDPRSQVRAFRKVAQGGLHAMSVRAADVLCIALRTGASGIVLVHNHPSGDPTPSVEDRAFTRRVARASAAVGLPLLDHVVVTRDAFVSVAPEFIVTNDPETH